jgi:diguanylate cyclase (GGDEF)-like protein/PAS domain S-box-containing protein
MLSIRTEDSAALRDISEPLLALLLDEKFQVVQWSDSWESLIPSWVCRTQEELRQFLDWNLTAFRKRLMAGDVSAGTVECTMETAAGPVRFSVSVRSAEPEGGGSLFAHFLPQGASSGTLPASDSPLTCSNPSRCIDADLFQSLLDALPNPVFFSSVEGRFLGCNRELERWLGIPRRELLGKLPSDILPADLAELCAKADREILESGRPCTYERQIDLADGSRRDVLVSKSPLTGIDGPITGIVGALHDLTELKGSQKALQETWELWRSVLDQMNDAVSIIDAHTFKIVGANKVFSRLFGIPREKVTESGCDETLFWLGRGALLNGTICPLNDEAPGGGQTLRERRITSEDGRSTWLEIATSPIVDEKGSLKQLVHVCRDITSRKEAEKRIDQLAYFDPLTELPNRSLLCDRLGQAVGLAQREERTLAVIHLDLDHFKKINDSLGHAHGDQVLKIVARRLRHCIPGSDTLARTGGNAFAAVLTSGQGVREVLVTVHHMQESLASPVKIGEHELFLEASIGIALFPDDGKKEDELLRHAELAMYEAKREGRNTYQFFSEQMNRNAFERLQLEVNLRQALRNNEFFMVYQPQISLDGMRVIGVEALMRWGHPTFGTVSPARFISLAEETGLIAPLGEWGLRQACLQAQNWQKEGLPPIRLGVNFSAVQLRQSDLTDRVGRIVKETGFDPRLLELELTESILMKREKGVYETLLAFKSMGMSLAIDDFGTGYSSLSYLRHFPIDRIKVAQEFVRDIPASQHHVEIVKAIVAMARSLDLELIAEGVETKAQLDLLGELGCREIQGFYFSPPLKALECAHIMRKGERRVFS